MNQQNLPPQTLKSFVKDHVENAILKGELSPGEKINESKLCEKLNLSKSPVREALTELVSEGILTKEDYKGISVSKFSDKELDELTNLRIALELMAVDYVVPYINEKSRNDLKAITEKIKEAAKNDDYILMADIDLEFHYYIIKLTQNQTLIDTWLKIFRKLRIQMYIKNMSLHDISYQYERHLKLVELFTVESYTTFKHHLTAHMI